MSDEDIKIGIANTVCSRFVNARATTSRRMLLNKFERPDLLDLMRNRGLVRSADDDRNNYLPTVSTFALLGDDHMLYEHAREAFKLVASRLYQLYKSEESEIDHEMREFADATNRAFHKPATFESISLGLYLTWEFSLLVNMKMSEDSTAVERFRISEQAIKMSDPMPYWDRRVATAREPLQAYGIQSSPFQASSSMGISRDLAQEPFDECGFWSLIHPAIAEEARSRFEAGHYADAVEAALKVVAQEVRDKTGLNHDGADLMHKAFSPDKPHLVFDDPMPPTRNSLQQGYMEIFAGTMSGVRNPKAHAIVELEPGRCVHFLFLASLLRHKVDEANPSRLGQP